MLTGELGVRLVAMIGKMVPLPAPPELMTALTRVEITCDEKTGDGVQLTFTLKKDGPMQFAVLQSGLLDTFNRLSIGVALGAAPVPLFNGVITHHQMAPGAQPGSSTLTVTGEGLDLLLNLKEDNNEFKNLPDFAIVNQVLLQHAQDGVLPPHVVMPTMQVRNETDYTVRQHETDLKFIKRLARQNGFVFYLQPTTLGSSHAFWGPQVRIGEPQHALTMNMGAWTNVKSLSFAEDARAPLAAKARVVEPISKMGLPIPPLTARHMPPLALRPTPPRRTQIVRNVANKNSADAAVRTRAAVIDAEDPVTGTGELDTARYGYVLQPRRLVGVRGVGVSDDGMYYVRRVTHVLARGEYTQRFTITREGRGALLPVVLV